MAIIYTYPPKEGNLNGDDILILSDSVDGKKTKSVTLKQIQNFTGGGGTGGGGLSQIVGTAPIQVSNVVNNSQTVSWSNPYGLGIAQGNSSINIQLQQDSSSVSSIGVKGGTGISVGIDNGELEISTTGGQGLGTVTSVGFSTGTTGLSVSSDTTNPITSNGTFTLAGTLSTSNGGTGLSSIGTANQMLQVDNAGTALNYVNEVYASERVVEKVWLDAGNVVPGTAVFVLGAYTDNNGDTWTAVRPADAAGKMPSLGLCLETAAAGSFVRVILQGEASIDTSIIAGSPSVGDIVYVATQPSTANQNLTVTRPTGSVDIQSIGIIAKDGTNGVIQVNAVLRANQLPNVQSPNPAPNGKGVIFVGNADNEPKSLPVGTDTQVLVADSNETLGVKWDGITASNLTAPGLNTEVIHNGNGNFAAHYGFTQEITPGSTPYETSASITTLKLGKPGSVGSLTNCNSGAITLYGINPSGAVGLGGAEQGKVTFFCHSNNHSVTIKGPQHSGNTPDNYSISLPLTKPSSSNNTLMWDGGSVSNNNYNLEWADSSGNNVWTRVTGTQTDIYFTGPQTPGKVGININAPTEDGLTVVGNLKVDSPSTGASGQAWVTPNNNTASGSSTTIDFNTGNVQELQLTNNVTIALSNLKEGATYIVVVKQSTSASYTVTWPSEVKWVGTAPVMTTVQSAVDVYSFVCTKAFGTTTLILGTASQNYTV